MRRCARMLERGRDQKWAARSPLIAGIEEKVLQHRRAPTNKFAGLVAFRRGKKREEREEIMGVL
jgi:hypothetical protein